MNAKKTLVEYPVTRGKPVLHKVGEELDTQQIDFFFSEEFCNPAAELVRLQMAYKLDLPLPLSLGNGAFFLASVMWSKACLKSSSTPTRVAMSFALKHPCRLKNGPSPASLVY